MSVKDGTVKIFVHYIPKVWVYFINSVRLFVIPFLNNYIPFATFVKYLKLVIWAIAALV